MSERVINVVVKDNDDMDLKMRRAIGILFKLRNATKQDVYLPSLDNTTRRMEWEARADDFLEELNSESLANKLANS